MTTDHIDVPLLCSLEESGASEAAACGGKAVGLHRLLRAGLPVPAGFCVTTAAFDRIAGSDPRVQSAIAHLATCVDAASLREGARAVREAVLACELPASFERSLAEAWSAITARAPVAVRSSATAEDLADASFAGQQDTFLSVGTEEALSRALLGCWASLFTERAVTYRRSHGFDGARVSMAVVVQRMVQAEAAGVLFTADPVTSRRGVSVIEAVRGLGEALVSGHATPERYRVRTRDRAVLERLGSDGAPLPPGEGLLAAGALEELCAMGARAEADAGTPMDLEWAVEGGRTWLLQARPITTLWPLPEGELPPGFRVLVSFGHMQVYTAPLTRVGSSMFRRVIPVERDERTGMSSALRVAGDRVYIDVTALLAREPFGSVFAAVLSNASDQIASRLSAARQRPELREVPASERVSVGAVARRMLPVFARALRTMAGEPRREREVYLRELHAGLERQLDRIDRARTTGERLDVLHEELGAEAEWLLFRALMPRLFPALLIGKVVATLAPRLLPGADPRALLQGLEGNVTTEMDLALADLADLARDVPPLAAALRTEDARAALASLRGDPACAPFFRAWDAFLDRFGHRGAGEIDPGVPRWREDPRIPLRSIAGSLDRPRGALRAQHAELARRALALRDDLVAAARERPFGALLAPITSGLIDRMRLFLGVREEHKFVMVKTVDRVRAVAIEAGELLARAGAVASAEDVWLLDLNEIRAAVHDVEAGRGPSLRALVAERRRARDRHAAGSPPAVMTGEGEVITVADGRATPPGSLAGTAVSGGVYEGIARVVHDPASEHLEAGEVLVARFTDPGWTPLFGHAGALVMEVGGQMTHGSVIAREIGIPAVVAVDGATSKLRTGDRVRVDGDHGWVTVVGGGAS